MFKIFLVIISISTLSYADLLTRKDINEARKKRAIAEKEANIELSNNIKSLLESQKKTNILLQQILKQLKENSLQR